MGIFSSKPNMPAPDENSPVALKVKNWIKQDTVVMFSKSYCPYCNMAKEVFNQINKKFTAIELDRMPEGEDPDGIQDYLLSLTGARSVPRVFINGNCVGGGSDVKDLHNKGELEKMFL